jgi:hypothetical protein
MGRMGNMFLPWRDTPGAVEHWEEQFRMWGCEQHLHHLHFTNGMAQLHCMVEFLFDHRPGHGHTDQLHFTTLPAQPPSKFVMMHARWPPSKNAMGAPNAARLGTQA